MRPQSTHSFRCHLALFHNAVGLVRYSVMIPFNLNTLSESPLSAIHHRGWNNKLSGFLFTPT